MVIKELEGSGKETLFPECQMGKVELLLITQRSLAAVMLQILFGPQCRRVALQTAQERSLGGLGGFSKDPAYHGSPLSYLF